MHTPPPPASFDPRRFIALARALGGAVPSDEAQLRTAIGRAYYTLFIIARDNLRIAGEEGVHAQVIYQLRRQDRRIGDQLDFLRHLRTIADYELLPRDPSRRDWARNWHDADALARRLQPSLEAIRAR